MVTINEGLQALAQHQFDPTLRQLMAQIMNQEAGGAVAAQALATAQTTITAQDVKLAEQVKRIAELEAQLARDAGVAAKTDARVEAVVGAMTLEKPPADIAARRANSVKAQ